nr:hypothetical protein [Tanacetum cinerariifolium]
EIRSWRFYALPTIHILETKAGDIIYMFLDKKYPLTPETIQRMLNHGLEINRDPAGNDLTTAIQWIQSLGPDMPLLAHMLNQGEPAFVQAQQQESLPLSIPFGPAPSSRVVSSEPIPDIPSLSEPSEPVLETIASPIRGDDTGGGSFHESPLRPPPATPTSSPTVGVAEEPLTLTSFLALFPTCLQRIATLEAELKATKILHRDTVVIFARRIKKLESKLKTKNRKLVLSDSENEEEARQSQELEALLDLANATLHEPSHSTTPSKPANPEYRLDSVGRVDSAGRVVSAGRVDSASELDSAGRVDSAVGQDSAGRVVSAGGVDSADGLIFAGVSVAAGPTVHAEPSSPIRDPSKGKAVATPSSPVIASTAKELADQQAAILEAKRQELLEQELKQSLDAEQVYLDSLLAQRVVKEQEREIMAFVAQLTQRQAKLDKVALNLTNEEWISLVDQVRANPTLSAELLGADVSEDTFSIRMTWKDVRGLTDDQLQIVYDKIRRAVDLATAKDHHQHLNRIVAGDPIPAVTSVSAASSVPAGTPIATGVSTTAGASGSATRRRTLPSPSKSESAALPFNEDDPEAEFKKYLRQVSDDDEPAEPVSLALVSDIRTWEIIPTDFGLGRADLMVLYGMVLDKYKVERATCIGLGLWSDLRTLITAKEDRDASIIWEDQDQWEIRSWRFYALPAIHVLETEAGDIIYMFVDKKDPAGNDLTTAIQLIQSLVNHLNPAA